MDVFASLLAVDDAESPAMTMKWTEKVHDVAALGGLGIVLFTCSPVWPFVKIAPPIGQALHRTDGAAFL